MTLLEFIQKLVEPNTLVRLWVKNADGGHTIVHGTCDRDSVAMSWSVTGDDWLAQYAACEVCGVTDICCDNYPEAVNIVIAGGAE